MSKKLFVGGLSWGTDNAALELAFGKFGEVAEAQVVLDRETNRSRGFGFVTYKQDDAAQKAIAEMNGSTLDGRTINVNEAHDRRGGGGSRW